MAIAFRAKQWAVQAGGTSLAPTEPAGAATDDIVVGLWIVDAAHSAFTPPTGWTLKGGAGVSCTTFTAYVCWIRRPGSAPSYSASWTGSVYAECWVAAYSGCATSGDPFDDYQSASNGSSITGPDAPSATSTVANTMALVMGAHWSGSTSAWGTTDGATVRSGASGDDVGLAELALAAAGAYDPAIFTGFGPIAGNRFGATGILKPAAAGGPTISVQPASAYLALGATNTFSVTASASGGGSLSYQWKVGGVNVSTGSGGTTSSWTTGTLALGDDNTSITCVVTETGGSSPGSLTSSAATLRVGVLLVASSTAVYTATGTPTTIAPAWPTTAILAGAVGKVVLVIGMKPATSGAGSVTTPSGWTLVGNIQAAGGYTGGSASAADTGNCDLYVYSIDDPGTITGTVTVTLNVGATNGVAWARMQRYSAPSGTAFSLAMVTGSDTSAGNVSITFGSDPGVDVGDRVLAAMCIPTDVTTPAQFSAEAITQTGVTFGTVTELEEPDSANNFDIGGFLVDAQATAGPSSAAPVLTATAGGTTTNVRGPGIFLRLRASASGSSAALTGGATCSGTLTGIGSLAASCTGGATVSGTLPAKGALAAALSGGATVSATGLLLGIIAAALSGGATVSGTIGGAGALTASLSASATVSGSAGGATSLAAALTGGATCSGTATAIGALGASCSGGATLSATAGAGGTISAACTAGATVAGTLSGTGALAASLSGGAVVSGTLPAAGALACSLAGGATVSGTITGITPIAANLSGGATCAGALSGTGSLAAACTAGAATSGTLTGKGALASALSGGATVTGTAVDGTGLNASLSGGAVCSGTLTGKGACAAAIGGGASTAGTIGGKGALAAALTAGATTTGALVAIGGLSAALSGGATCSGTIGSSSTQSASLTGGAACTGTLTGKGALAAALSGGASVAGTMSVTGSLGCSLTGGSSCTGTLTGAGALQASLGAGANAVGSLGGTGALAAALTGGATCIGTTQSLIYAAIGGGAVCSGSLLQPGQYGRIQGTFGPATTPSGAFAIYPTTPGGAFAPTNTPSGRFGES